MSQPCLTESQEKVRQRTERDQPKRDPTRSFQGGPNPILQLQRILGNQHVAQLIKSKRLTTENGITGLQPKLTVGAADDQYEQEADRIARQVVSMPDSVASLKEVSSVEEETSVGQIIQSRPLPLAASITPVVQRKTEPAEVKVEEEKDKENEEDDLLQAKFFDKSVALSLQRLTAEGETTETFLAKPAESLTDSFEAGEEVESRLSQSKGQGSPLPDHVRSYMEPRFGVNLSHVRVHSGSDAIQMNRDVGAQAFTHGSDIYFGAGHSPSCLELTAHELTHVIQQTGSQPLQTKKRAEEVRPPSSEPSIRRICAACAAEDREERGSDWSDSLSQQARPTAADARAVSPVALAAARFAAPAATDPGSPFHLQRKVDEESFARHGGRIEEVGDTTGGGFGEGSADSNEFLLWNYHVGRPEPQAAHTRYLTEKVLAPQRWPDMLRADGGLKVAVVGGASSTGGAAVTTPLSVARADRIKASLVSGGIDANRIVTRGVGSRRPYADETSPENMARNRRVEVFLFRPTRRVASLAGVSVTATNLSASVSVGFNRDTSDPKLLVLRWRPFIFSADIDAAGPANMTVGILQFLRSDSRVGAYRSTGAGGGFLLDFGRCMQPDLPCKDVAESRGRFSGPGQLTGPGRGKVSMVDSPGNSVPIEVSDPKSGTLVTAHWEMEFVAVIGAQVGDTFLPVKFVVWRLEDDHALDSSGVLNPTKTDAKAEAPHDGAPDDLAIEQAMAGPTCRFMARRMHDYCRPELV